jgi:very-short-patch-repair endonuclease
MERRVRPHNIVVGQRIDAAKVEQSKIFRRHMTPAERVLWEALRRNSMAGLHFRRQQVIAGFIVDFYCHAAGLAVEVDGPAHEMRAEYDAERDSILATLGIRVMRLKNEEVLDDLTSALEKIAKLAEET